MESRILKIWDVDEHGKPASKYRDIYCGDYFEHYKVTTKAMKLCPEWKEFRIGIIQDDGTGRFAVFRQLVNDFVRPVPLFSAGADSFFDGFQRKRPGNQETN